jgi:hypothetical protein
MTVDDEDTSMEPAQLQSNLIIEIPRWNAKRKATAMTNKIQDVDDEEDEL